jgi:hypothetical protein
MTNRIELMQPLLVLCFFCLAAKVSQASAVRTASRPPFHPCSTSHLNESSTAAVVAKFRHQAQLCCIDKKHIEHTAKSEGTSRESFFLLISFSFNQNDASGSQPATLPASGSHANPGSHA